MSAVRQAHKVNDVYFELLYVVSDRENEQEEFKLLLHVGSCFSSFLSSFRLSRKEPIQNSLEGYAAWTKISAWSKTSEIRKRERQEIFFFICRNLFLVQAITSISVLLKITGQPWHSSLEDHTIAFIHLASE